MATLVYRYGVIKGPSGPVQSAMDQIRLAHQYRNELVALELSRRAEVDAALAEFSPELAGVEAEIGIPATDADPEAGVPAAPATGLVLQLEQLDARAMAARADSRSRAPSDPALQAEFRTVRTRLKELRARRKELRAALFADAAWEQRNAEIEERYGALQRAARAKASEAGLYWGTYLLVEEAADRFRKGAPPQFQAWSRRRQRLGVQIQGGISVDELLGGEDTRLALTVSSRLGAQPGSRRAAKKRQGLLLFRIGSTGRGNRQPVWLEVPIVYHRDLPRDARIKWARLHREEVGPTPRWSVHFVLTTDEPRHPGDATDGSVGVDVGWRVMPDGRLRVAVWAGSDGRQGELALPRWWVGEQEKVRRIQAERSRLMDAVRPVAVEVVAGLAGRLPEWPRRDEDLASLHQWRSQARLAALVVRLRDAGLDVAQLEEWRKRDRHLWLYEAHLRDQLDGSRKDLYRRFADQLGRDYGLVAIEDLDLREFHVLPPTEAGVTRTQEVMRTHVRNAALSVLIGAVRHRLGGRVNELDPAATTTTCHACGRDDPEWRDHAELRHACAHCGAEWDQDLNAARNLLRSGGRAPDAWPGPQAPLPVTTYDRAGPNRGQRRRIAAAEEQRSAHAGA